MTTRRRVPTAVLVCKKALKVGVRTSPWIDPCPLVNVVSLYMTRTVLLGVYYIRYQYCPVMRILSGNIVTGCPFLSFPFFTFDCFLLVCHAVEEASRRPYSSWTTSHNKYNTKNVQIGLRLCLKTVKRRFEEPPRHKEQAVMWVRSVFALIVCFCLAVSGVATPPPQRPNVLIPASAFESFMRAEVAKHKVEAARVGGRIVTFFICIFLFFFSFIFFVFFFLSPFILLRLLLPSDRRLCACSHPLLPLFPTLL